jgi:hypothetical protein
MLVRGRVVYFGASGAPALEYVRSLPMTACTSPYQSWQNEVVSTGWRADGGRRCRRSAGAGCCSTPKFSRPGPGQEAAAAAASCLWR